ncbi:STAS-like domain-containing protein [Acinetobacter baumannii]|uniref:STAS-like domain-containing protein n=1 Tax=Acinetobacter baumannii TaxID=470 RepID=UPI0022BF1198|nr:MULTISPECIES: STAS-like domain-containing protein [Acinetobacter calcoaceticus/baumannii complex]MCZ2977917.1 STAS-like domain-containing protein [Acinetobacter baumannii]MDI9703740.1 STAS-like domain-containing protein [Acinetobacter baumannii]MDI9805112.1 STAS-like domain-containing protein [Acinetobacter baumannii]
MKRINNPAMLEAMLPVRKELKKLKTVTIILPKSFGLKDHDAFNFEKIFKVFDWNITNCPVKIDLTKCTSSDYQALSLIVLYAWHLKNNGCKVEFLYDRTATSGVGLMWKRLGATGTFPVLLEPNQQFKGDNFKPLFALRKGNNNKDFKNIISAIESYTSGFDISYTDTLRYVLSELMYNTQEHGTCYSQSLDILIPSIVQLCWYQNKDVIQFIIADLGMGIKKHIEQSYPGLSSDEEAIKLSIQPEKSGTFAITNPYNAKNNAGMGLYLSSNIIRKLKGEMYIVSGNGLVHISPRDITSKTLENSWNGTIAFLVIKLKGDEKNDLQTILQELRKNAESERNKQKQIKEDEQFVVHMSAYFGDFAEIKEEAINFRDKYLLPAIEDGKKIIIDCQNVKSAPHSFLNALLATPIKRLGMSAYKQIRIINAEMNIRETIDFILEDNTN